LISKIKSTIAEYEEDLGETPTSAELADILGVTESIIEDAMRAPTYTSSLSHPIGKDETGTLQDIIPDDEAQTPDEAIDRVKMTMAVRKGLQNLTAREEKIIRLRFGIAESMTNDAEYPISAHKYFKMMEGK
jgi:RNA polymerase primary sigma factor